MVVTYKRGDKVKVLRDTKSVLPYRAIGWQGVVHNNMTNIDGRIWVVFPTGFLGRDEIWYVQPDDIELVKEN